MALFHSACQHLSPSSVLVSTYSFSILHLIFYRIYKSHARYGQSIISYCRVRDPSTTAGLTTRLFSSGHLTVVSTD